MKPLREVLRETSGISEESIDGLLLCLGVEGYAIVPIDPTWAMERAYFMAPIPAFKSKANHAERKRQNRKKMVSRWQAMVNAAFRAECPPEPDTSMDKVERANEIWAFGHKR